MSRVTLRSFYLTDFGESGCWMPFACAVTAYDERDALEMVGAVYSPTSLPTPGVVEELTPEEIMRRIGHFDFGVPVVRGVWYPHVNTP